MNINLFTDSMGINNNGDKVLKDLWPSSKEINEIINNSLSTNMFLKGMKRYTR